MIKILCIEAMDTFSYRHLSFNFTSGLHSIEGENGSSKTSIFLALIHCLANKNPKGCKVDDVSNKITGKPYEIKVAAELDGRLYNFVNSKKTGTVQIYKEGIDISQKRIPDNLKMIQEILGADFTLLCDLLYQSKDSTLDLLETGTDRGRKQFINRVLKMAEIDEQASRMKDKEKDLGGKNGTINMLVSQIQTLESALGEVSEDEEELATAGTEAEIFTLTEKVTELADTKWRTEEALKALQQEIATAEGEKAARDRLASLEANYLPPRVQDIVATHSIAEDTQAEIHALKININCFRNDLAQAAKVQEQLDLLEMYRAELSDTPKPDKEKGACLDQLGKITRVHTTTVTKLADVKKKMDEYAQALLDRVCPTCGSAENWERIKASIKTLQVEHKEYEELIRKCEEGIEKYNERLRLWGCREKIEAEISKLAMVAPVDLDVAAVEQRLGSYEKKIAQLQAKALEIKQAISEYHAAKELEAQISKLKAELKGVELDTHMYLREDELTAKLALVSTDLSEATVRVTSLRDRLDVVKQHNAWVKARREMNRQITEKNMKLQLQISQSKTELANAENKLDCVKEWNGILGNKGFRVARINRFLRSLNATMVKYSQMICNGRIRCVFFVNPDGEIEFSISDSAKEMDYPLWSGGEKARIRMVCLFAVLELLEVMGSVSFNVLCLDEVFDQLDNDGKEGLFKVLEYLKSKGKAIYVIAHSELTLDLNYDTVVRAVKHQDGTTEILQG